MKRSASEPGLRSGENCVAAQFTSGAVTSPPLWNVTYTLDPQWRYSCRHDFRGSALRRRVQEYWTAARQTL